MEESVYEIVIASSTDDVEQLRSELEVVAEQYEWSSNGVMISQPGLRLEPVITVALIGLASAQLAALITGVFSLAKAKETDKIVIQAGDNRLEYPPSISDEEMERIVANWERLRPERIDIQTRQT
jgi:hypothetical protein